MITLPHTPARVVIAVDSFKGTTTAAVAARAIADGWRAARPADAVVLRPMADGGEGTLATVAAAYPGAERRSVTVTGPDGAPVATAWLHLPPTTDGSRGTAVVELAGASGIELLGDRRLPLDAHTRGFGEAIADALRADVSRLVLAIGGSASTDGGAGMLTALGARLLDAAGVPIPNGGRGLPGLAAVDLAAMPSLPPDGITVLTDVTSPLTGPTGAAAVFGPQKGATPQQVRELETGLVRWADALGVDPSTPGAGAAGGTGYALLAWGARLVPGAAAVAELIGLPSAMAGSTLVITGEGAFDAQSAAGKVPLLVAGLASAAGVRTALIAGRIDQDASTAAFADTVSLTALGGTTAAALRDPARWLCEAGRRLAERFRAD